MDKKQLHESLMANIKKSLKGLDTEKSVNEAARFDKTNKLHKEAYNSFVKWYNRWNGKLEHMEMVALMKKIENDVRLLNIAPINESMADPRDGDEHQAFDLLLWFENTRELWEKFGVWTANCINKKRRRGTEPVREYLVYSSVVDQAARATVEDYRKEYPGTFVSASTRKALKEKIADRILEFAQDEWDYEQNNK